MGVYFHSGDWSERCFGAHDGRGNAPPPKKKKSEPLSGIEFPCK